MSTIKQSKVKSLNNMKIMVESFSSADEVVNASNERPITDSCFHDMRTHSIDKSWHGVSSYQEALDYMKNGYQPTVDKMKNFLKNVNLSGVSKRITFKNDVVGYAPVVPLALQGVPTCMRNSYMKPIKAKVIDIYYDMTASCSTSTERILKAGQSLLGAVVALEAEGYKFNLYAIQSYSDSHSADMLCVKVKSSNTPLDLKRISFPLTHPAYFRVIGFDWYSKTPKGKYRSAYGKALGYSFNSEQMTKGFEELFGRKCVVFNCSHVLSYGVDQFKEAIKNAGKC